MTNHDNKMNIKRYGFLIDLGLAVLVLLALIYVWPSLAGVIRPFIYAFFLAFLLNPLVKLLQHRGMHRVLAILIVFLLLVGLLAGLIMAIVPQLAQDVALLGRDVPRLVKFVEQFLADFRDGNLSFIPDFVFQYIDIDKELSRLTELLSDAFDRIYQFLIASTGTLLDIILTPIIAFYYLKDKDKIQLLLMKTITLRHRAAVKDAAHEIRKALGGFLRGQLIVACFVGVLTGLGCFIIGLPHALTIGLIAGITNIIPYFGPFLGGILPVILALMNRPITALWVIVLIVVVQQVESNLLSPQVMAHSVGLHPLLVIFSVLFFGKLFGVAGMILGVPITASVLVLARFTMQLRSRYRSPIIIE